MTRRVVVTGMGQISALGTGVPAFFERLLRGESGIAPLDGVKPPGLPDPIGGAVPDWRPECHLSLDLVQATWRATHLAYVAGFWRARPEAMPLRAVPVAAFGLTMGFVLEKRSHASTKVPNVVHDLHGMLKQRWLWLFVAGDQEPDAFALRVERHRV